MQINRNPFSQHSNKFSQTDAYSCIINTTIKLQNSSITLQNSSVPLCCQPSSLKQIKNVMKNESYSMYPLIFGIQHDYFNVHPCHFKCHWLTHCIAGEHSIQVCHHLFIHDLSTDTWVASSLGLLQIKLLGLLGVPSL